MQRREFLEIASWRGLAIMSFAVSAAANAQGQLLRNAAAIDNEFRGYCIESMAAAPMRESMRRSEFILPNGQIPRHERGPAFSSGSTTSWAASRCPNTIAV